MSVPIHRLPPFFNISLYIHLFSPTVFSSLHSLYIPDISPLSSLHMDPTTPPLCRNSIHPSLLQRPLRPIPHNEISASLIVLIKAVRKELREGKYCRQQGGQRFKGALCFSLPSPFNLYLNHTSLTLSILHPCVSLHPSTSV